MAGRVQWVDSIKSVIQVETGAAWTLDDLSANLRKAFTMVDQTVGQITIILVLNPRGSLPSGFVLQLKNLLTLAPANLHRVIIISQDVEVESALHIFRRLYSHMRYMVSLVPTFNHAEALMYANGNFWLTPTSPEEIGTQSEDIAS